jgi:hypothetical protein
MPNRKDRIHDAVRSAIPERMLGQFDQLTKTLRRADREEIAKDIAGLPESIKRILVGNLRKSGRLAK